MWCVSKHPAQHARHRRPRYCCFYGSNTARIPPTHTVHTAQQEEEPTKQPAKSTPFFSSSKPTNGVKPATTPLATQDDSDDVIIELRDVHKSFGNKEVLRGVSLKIRRGEAVGIIGGSGTGKSTTLRLIAGLVAPDKVRMGWCGWVVHRRRAC